MNACAKKRKLLVELAMEALEPGEARALWAHLESCAGCRQYLAEISSLSARLKTVESRSDIETTEAFHQRVMRAVRNAEAGSEWQVIADALRVRPMNWRWVASGLGGLAVLVAVVLLLLSRPSETQHASTPAQTQVNLELDSELPPSVANYRIAANRSLDQLDELLTQQANRRVSTRPIYSASLLTQDARLSD